MLTPDRPCILCLMALVLSLAMALACNEDISPPDFEEPTPEVIPAPDSPENLIEAIAVIYEDELRTADERFDAYENLFPADESDLQFVFHFMASDVQHGLPPSWGLAEELEVHRHLFDAQAAGGVFSLTLSLQYLAAEPLPLPDIGQEDWRQVRVTNTNLRLLHTPNDGFEINGGQARFCLAPENDRWFICEWHDLPRPQPAPALDSAVEASTWGSLKSMYR
jgi:hypothetical protein